MANKSLLGFAAAGAVGVLIGIIVAPESGNKNVKKIKRFVNDWASKMLDEIEAGKSSLGEFADEAEEKAYELKGKAKAKVEDFKDSAYELKGEAAAKAEDFADEVKQTYSDVQSETKRSFS